MGSGSDQHPSLESQQYCQLAVLSRNSHPTSLQVALLTIKPSLHFLVICFCLFDWSIIYWDRVSHIPPSQPWTHHIKNDLKLLIFLSPPPACWKYDHVPSCSDYAVLGIKPSAPCMAGRPSTTWAVFSAFEPTLSSCCTTSLLSSSPPDRQPPSPNYHPSHCQLGLEGSLWWH